MALLAPSQSSAYDDAATRVLRLRFARGIALEAAGRWADALERFEGVAQARPTTNVRYHVALCLERLGRLRRARRTYRAARNTLPRANADVLAEIDARLLELDARMPRILVDVIGAPEGVSLLLDGQPLPAAYSVRVDPGPHVAVALRRGVPVAAAAFAVAERRTTRVVLTVHKAPW